MNLAKQEWAMQNQYEKLGYTLMKKVIDKEIINSIRQEILLPFSFLLNKNKIEDKDLFEIFKDNFQDYISCTKISHQLPSLYNLGLSDPVLGFIKQKLKLEFPVINTRPVLLFSSDRLAKHHFYWRSDSHQDCAIMKGSSDAVVAWIPLCDINEDFGYLQVVPESHNLGILPHEKDGPSKKIIEKINEDKFISIPIEMGDILFFSSRLIHRSGLNKSDSIRMTVSYRFDNLLNKDFIEQKYPIGFDYVMKE